MAIDPQTLARILRRLERKGLAESRMCPDGQIRWFLTEKGTHTRPEDVEDIDDERLN
jgi:DNA-binding MarR family transcriptional regulator